MQNTEKLSTPTRHGRDLFPSSPDSIFSSPHTYGVTSWTPGRTALWSINLNSREGIESTPSNQSFTSFQTPNRFDLTPNTDPGDFSGQKDVDNCKRGRPRADVITHLIHEGSSSPSGIKCKVCNRVFPREKSLQAHLRTHTGERPYICDYPGCSRAFTQSGQLKTHQRLHAGEKPFVCSSPGCGNRYTHANRTCPLHPYHKPQRSVEIVLQPTLSAGEDPNEVSKWLENYRRERLDKSTPAKSGNATSTCTIAAPIFSDSLSNSTSSEVQVSTTLPRVDLLMTSPFSNALSASNSTDAQPLKRLKSKRGLASELEQENVTSFQSTPVKIPHLFPSSPFNRSSIQSPLMTIPSSLLPRSPIKNCSNLIPTDLSTNVTRRAALGDITPTGNELSSPSRRLAMRRTPPASPIKTLNLKKRWLKEVVQEQKRQTLPVSPPQQQQQQQQQQIQTIDEEEPDSENLALPISWNDNENDTTGVSSYAARFRRSPLAWSAVSALVEMAEQSHQNNQPLNLSMSRRKC